MKRTEEYAMLTDVDQTVTVESDFEGIRIRVTEDKQPATRIYLSIVEAEELAEILVKAISYQEQLKKKGIFV